jgi:hypothetical protein
MVSSSYSDITQTNENSSHCSEPAGSKPRSPAFVSRVLQSTLILILREVWREFGLAEDAIFLANIGWKDGTLKLYTRVWSNFCTYMLDLKVVNFSYVYIINYIATKGRIQKCATIRTLKSALCTCATYIFPHEMKGKEDFNILLGE